MLKILTKNVNRVESHLQNIDVRSARRKSDIRSAAEQADLI